MDVLFCMAMSIPAFMIFAIELTVTKLSGYL